MKQQTLWTSVKLGQVADLINGDRGKNYPSQSHRVAEGIPFINAGHLDSGLVRLDSMDYITEERFKLLRGGRVQRDDILLCIRGTLGRVAIATADVVPAAIASSLVIIRPGHDVVPRFLLALLSSPRGQQMISSYDNGAAQPNVGARDVARLEIHLPPLGTQQKIAAILAAYDDLIERNRLRVKLLEEMARRIYHEWFVEFRFPGEGGGTLVASELGLMPEGWSVSPLSSLARITMGQSPPSSAYNTRGLGLPFHQGVGSYGPNFPIHNVYSSAGTRIAEPGDILVSVRAPVGRINLADRRLILGRGLCAIRAGEARRGFLWQALRLFFREEDIMGGGSIFQSVTKRDMEGLRLPWPGRTLAGNFSDISEPIWDQLHSLTSEVANLRSTRDLLLPKLVSGAIDVTDLDIAMPPTAA